MRGHIKIDLVSRLIWIDIRTCDTCCKYSKEPYCFINGITRVSTKLLVNDELETISKENIVT
jgi:hypothetical protein